MRHLLRLPRCMVTSVEQRISFVTLVVRDLDRSRQFYLHGLGWSAELDAAGEVLMIRVAEKLMLSLWQHEAAEAELGPIDLGQGRLPFTLAHNVATPSDVDLVLQTARQAGAAVSRAQERQWGGYSGYFADPDGFQWEVAFNPGPIGLSVL